MRVLHIAQSDGSGGAAKAAYRIHRGLREFGIESSMLVASKLSSDPFVYTVESAWKAKWLKATPYLDRLLWRVPGFKHQDYRSLSLFGANIMKDIKKHRPDIVHLHWICAGYIRPTLLRQIEVPMVWRLADMWPICGTEHYVDNIAPYRFSVRTTNGKKKGLLNHLNVDNWAWSRKLRAWKDIKNLHIVAPSEWMAECAKQSKVFHQKPVSVIPTGQDTRVFQPVDKQTARSKLGLPSNKKLILAGTLGFERDPRKGSDLFQLAAEQLASTRDDCTFVFFGDSNDTIINKPENSFHFGRIQDPDKLALVYSACDVFVAPSRLENLANTVIEAMASGVPCAAFAIGGMPDIIKPGKTGYLARPYDTADLAKGIGQLVDQKWGNLKENCVTFVRDHFSMDSQTQSYIDLYKTLIITKPEHLRHDAQVAKPDKASP